MKRKAELGDFGYAYVGPQRLVVGYVKAVNADGSLRIEENGDGLEFEVPADAFTSKGKPLMYS